MRDLGGPVGAQQASQGGDDGFWTGRFDPARVHAATAQRHPVVGRYEKRTASHVRSTHRPRPARPHRERRRTSCCPRRCRRHAPEPRLAPVHSSDRAIRRAGPRPRGSCVLKVRRLSYPLPARLSADARSAGPIQLLASIGSSVLRLDHAPERSTSERVQGQLRLARAKSDCVSAPMGRQAQEYARGWRDALTWIRSASGGKRNAKWRSGLE